MTISNKISRIALAAIIVVSLCISAFYLNTKQGYHEDELLTYNLANSSKQLNIGGWNTPEDMNEYLAVYPEHRFDYAQVRLFRIRSSTLRTRRFTTRWCTRSAHSSPRCSASGWRS